ARPPGPGTGGPRAGSPWWAPARARRRAALPGMHAGSRARWRSPRRSFDARIELQHRRAFALLAASEAVLGCGEGPLPDVVVVAHHRFADQHSQVQILLHELGGEG